MKNTKFAAVLLAVTMGVFFSPATATSTIYGLKSQYLLSSGRYADPPTHLYSFSESCSDFQDLGSVTLDGSEVDADGLAFSPSYGLLAFLMSHDYSQSILVSINPTDARASAIGPWLSREIRGAAFDHHGSLWVLDHSANELLQIDPANGNELPGSSVGLTLNGDPFDLWYHTDVAIRASSGAFFVTSQYNVYALDAHTGALSEIHADSPLELNGATFSANSSENDHLFVFDDNITDDLYRYDIDDSFARTDCVLDILNSYNAGLGDLAADVCSQTEAGLCGDGIDNDCDGKIDAADPDCAPAPWTAASVANASVYGAGPNNGSDRFNPLVALLLPLAVLIFRRALLSKRQ